MGKVRMRKGRSQGDMPDVFGGKFEYDRADEKRKIQEEIEDFLEDRQDNGTNSGS